MNCSLHNNIPATNTCEICGNGICNECMEQTDGLGKFCIPCAINWLDEAITELQKYCKWLKTKTILLSIGWTIGVILLLCAFFTAANDDDTARWTLLSLGIIFCGLPTAIATWSKTKFVFDTYENERGASYTAYGNSVYRNEHYGVKIAFSIIGLLLGIIVTPIQAIISGINLKKYRSYIPTGIERRNEIYAYYESATAEQSA